MFTNIMTISKVGRNPCGFDNIVSMIRRSQQQAVGQPALGLKSLNTAVIFLSVTYEDSSAFDQVDICLPKIITSTDTVEIAHADMRVSQDFIAGLEIVHDGTGNKAAPPELVDSAGYQYKSYWVANANLPPEDSLWRRYNRSYPRDSSSYLWWDRERDSCNVTFLRDSLYSVGGYLTIRSFGYFNRIENINNIFYITTDSITGDSAVSLKEIYVDSNPDTSQIADSLEYDIIRAVAWNESSWRQYRTPGEHYPLENTVSTMTGMMQISHHWWEDVFNGRLGGYDSGFVECEWDSLAWNWAITIHNGDYIFHTDNFKRMTDKQDTWDSLYLPASDFSPDSANREDLSSYGYHLGAPAMREIITKEAWEKYVKNNAYVNNIRRSKDRKPWQN